MIALRSAALLDWYRQNTRHLPWRGAADPWAIFVSEVMLQQTQSDRVARRFGPFMERFPNVETCAAASVGDVLTAWSGLGYNARAMRLHQAAQIIGSEGWPTEPATLQALPGVGVYTAAAVACFAFGHQVAAVDTNAKRVLSRWHGAPLSGRTLQAAADADIVRGEAAAWNQAVMDLGAGICRPRTPKCGECPVVTWCLDPTNYQAPPRQSTFAGSNRETRGAVVRTLVEAGQQLATAALAAHMGQSPDAVAAIAATLQAEGIIECGTHGWRLPPGRPIPSPG